MSHKLLDHARRRLAAETGPQPSPWGGRLSVALVYPNTYHHAIVITSYSIHYTKLYD